MESLAPETVFIIGVIIEALLLGAATVWMNVEQINLSGLFHCNRKIVITGLNAGLAVTLFNLLIWLMAVRLHERSALFKSWYDLIYLETLPLFGRLNFFQRFFLSASAGVCEEIFFRGVVEADSGILMANLFFAFAHMPKLYYISYAGWAMAVGFLMSFLKAKTGGLIAPIIAHTLIDVISLSILVGIYKRRQALR